MLKNIMTIVNHLVATDLEVTQYLRISVIRCCVIRCNVTVGTGYIGHYLNYIWRENILLDMSVYQNSVCVFLMY